MSIVCPYCKATLTPKGLKPGKYTPKCPKCGKPFALIVPAEDGGTIAIQEIAKPVPKPAEPPKRADPNATGDFTDVSQRTPVPRAGEATGDFTEGIDGNKPSTAADATAATDPSSHTGDFTEPEDGKPKPAPKPAKKAKVEKTELDDDLPPRLGGYEVLRVLGKGGMGAVLLGRQISLDRKVALKVMHKKIAQNPSYVARFTREAYAAAQLTHHNVVQIYDIGEEQGRHFFSMEFVQGRSLMDLVKEDGILEPEVAAGYVLQAARGLRYGHNQGMVHRDIKPDNLMVNTEGIVKVADLGLVKLPTEEAVNPDRETQKEDPEERPTTPGSGFRTPHLTRIGAVMGTPSYMSPEQAKNSANVDGRADIYSLGCSLYVLLTGKTPFEGKTALEIISKHQTEAITPPDLVVKRVPKSLSAIVLKMTAKDPADRYQSMDELIAALEGFLGVEKSATFTPSQEQADRLERCALEFNEQSKEGLKKTLAVAFLAVCVVGVIGAAVMKRPGLLGGLLGLMVMTPIAYFVIHGVMTGSVVASKARAVVFGMRILDWLALIGGIVLFLATLYLFGLLGYWVGFAVLAVGLGFLLWYLTDRAQAQAQEAPLDVARALFKSLRLSGLDEERLREFVSKFSGSNWEPFYEAVFGYEAKIAARATRGGELTRKHGAWREPVLARLDARLEARRLAKERKLLQRVEERALEAEGVSRGEAKEQAQALAADLVDQAAGVKQARKEGKEADLKAIVLSARKLRKPVPGFNIAGVPLRNLWFKHFLNDWFGRRLRFLLGAVLFAAGLLWLHQNNLLADNKALTALSEGNVEAAQKAAEATSKAVTKPLTLPGGIAIPTSLQSTFNSWSVPITGLMVLLNAMFYFGWRPTVVTVPGAAIALFGPKLGIPNEVGPLTAQHVSLIAGAVLIFPVAWWLRD